MDLMTMFSEDVDLHRERLLDILQSNQDTHRGHIRCLRKLCTTTLLEWDVTILGGFEVCASTANGPVRGYSCTNVVGGCGCIHSEQNMIGYMMRNPTCVNRAVLLLPWSPCTHCANLIVAVQPLIYGVIYRDMTPHDLRGIDILSHARIPQAKIS